MTTGKSCGIGKPVNLHIHEPNYRSAQVVHARDSLKQNVALIRVCSKAKGTYSAIRLCRAIADPISSPPEQLQARSLGTTNDINKGECVSSMRLHRLLMIERRMLVRAGKKTLPSGDGKGKSRADRVWVENQGHVEARRVPLVPFHPHNDTKSGI